MALNISKLERELNVKLPRAFVAALTSIDKTCTDWPPDQAEWGESLLDTNIDRLIALNKQFRKNPSKYVSSPKSIAAKWPEEYIVFECNGPHVSFFDSTDDDPKIQTIYGKRIEARNQLTPRHLDNFRELTKFIKQQYTRVRKAVRERDQESRMRDSATRRPAPEVECPDLLEQGRLLARPALRLAASGDTYAAVWGGDGVVAPPERGTWRHWLTVGCSHLPLNPRGLKGLISVYELVDDGKIRVMHNDRARLPRQPDGEKLFGVRFKCLPSIGVVLSKGSSQVRTWLRGQGVWSGDAEGAHFDDREPIDRYESEFQASHPYFLKDCDAMLGGWGIVYPDSKWRNLMSKSLLVTTFRDAEPWLEVYDSGKAFSCYSRIT